MTGRKQLHHKEGSFEFHEILNAEKLTKDYPGIQKKAPQIFS
jgi:hypothetical protein